MENISVATKWRSYIDRGRLRTGASNEVISTEVLVVNENVGSWVWPTPLIGARRVWLFVSDPVSWSIDWGCIEAFFELIRFRTLSSAIHSIGTEEWNYTLRLIQGRSKFVSDTVIQLIFVCPGLSILGVETGRYFKYCTLSNMQSASRLITQLCESGEPLVH